MGRPLAFIVTGGNANDCTQFTVVMEAIRVPRPGPGRPRVRPSHVLGDKGYSSRAIRTWLRRRGISHTIPERADQVTEPPLRTTLLAQNSAGWARLCRLVSAAQAEADGAAPVVSWPALRAYADQDLVVLLGPSSEPVRALSAGRPDVAEQLLAPWREFAGEQLRLEAVYLGRQGTAAGSLRLAARTVGLADQLGVRTVLTNAVRYADPDQHRLADVLDAARLLRPV
ncbi:DNA polymerase III subunit alpha, partial [Streptomyces gancidicus BKS 13-15]